MKYYIGTYTERKIPVPFCACESKNYTILQLINYANITQLLREPVVPGKLTIEGLRFLV